MIIARRILLRMRNISEQKNVQKIKTHVLCSVNFFFRKSCLVRDNEGKYGIAGQATDNNILLLIRFACRVTKAPYTHSE